MATEEVQVVALKNGGDLEWVLRGCGNNGNGGESLSPSDADV